MRNKIAQIIAFVVSLATTFSCEFDYRTARASRLSGNYIAEKTYNTLTGKTIALDSATTRQFLSFGDTLRITRRDSIIEQMVSCRSKNWVGRRSNGIIIYSGMTWYGRKDFKIEIEEIQTYGTGRITLGTIMKEPYDEKLDTLKTVYRRFE